MSLVISKFSASHLGIDEAASDPPGCASACLGPENAQLIAGIIHHFSDDHTTDARVAVWKTRQYNIWSLPFWNAPPCRSVLACILEYNKAPRARNMIARGMRSVAPGLQTRPRFEL